MRAYAAITSVMGVVGAVLLVMLTSRVGNPLVVVSIVRLLAVLLAALGLYSAWALPGGKM